MVPKTLGKNQFHSFYRSFLKRLFFEGLDGEARPAELTRLIGDKIPYLNGGIFAEHPIERAHPDIQIPDSAFEKIFDFFDRYHWHLDDRPLGNDREINPEVLGYVFEKYTNQKEMGAYYTKEDITEYISKNTILPFLLQKVAAKLPASAWVLLQADPDRYLYEAVRRGAGTDEKAWRKSLPENIAIGLDTAAPDLIRRRKDWNTPTPATHALPTEIWRETIARHQRCHELRQRLRAGEVRDPADLVTLNLDIRQFVQDVIANAPADLALALWKALRDLSVLDPTCGSGAFLFAALEILVPLYEGLLERFRALLADWERSGEKHPLWEKEFRAILNTVARHPNEAYFIHKTLIVHNLYGVDIMEEAVEICKLRLFLKLAAQLEPGQEIEPLPDIDFNVRAGNTLVGYATREEIRRAFTEAGGSGQMMLQGIETSLDDYNRIMEQAEDADRAFRRFQDLQDTSGQSAAEFRTAKEDLERRLGALRSQLDRFLAGQYDQKNLKTEAAFAKWRDSHEPFHWFVEFYGIMNSGGFDVIVGNPPYLEIREISYELRGFRTCETGAVHAICIERSLNVSATTAWVSMIVPMALPSTQRMKIAQNLIESSGRDAWYSNFSWRPGRLFETVNRALTIFLSGPGSNGISWSTGYQKWNSESRNQLFYRQNYVSIERKRPTFWAPKFSDSNEEGILVKLRRVGKTISSFSGRSETPIYYRTTGGLYWKVFTDFAPKFLINGAKASSSRETKFTILKKSHSAAVVGTLNGSVFWWWYTVTSNLRDLNPADIQNFPVPETALNDPNLAKLGRELMTDMIMNSSMLTREQRSTGTTQTQSFKISKSKPIIDKIDTVLAQHYGFTEEELDFIINYDIKYRMGLGGGVADSESEE